MSSKECGHADSEFIRDCDSCELRAVMELHLAKMNHPAFGGANNYFANLPQSPEATTQSNFF